MAATSDDIPDEEYSSDMSGDAGTSEPRFGVEKCGAYRQDICDGYGVDEFCDNCRYINDFVDWWSQDVLADGTSHEKRAVRAFHELLHGDAEAVLG